MQSVTKIRRVISVKIAVDTTPRTPKLHIKFKCFS